MKPLERNTEEYIRKNFLVSPGDRVICALSGGCDSVCLLLLLERLSGRLGLSGLSALHIHHGIRGQEADRDEAFCRKLCRDLHLPLTVRHEDIPALAKASGETLEEAGRRRRLEIFGEEARAVLEVSQEASAGAARPVKIAAAHHADDQAETVLMNLARGSGPSGLSGMRPVREDERGFTLIRPLLSASRAEIEAYVRARGCGWCEDSTNASGENTRSRLRQDVMPQLETILPGAARHMAAFAEKEREQEDFLDGLAKQSLAEVQSEGGSLKLPALSSLHSVLRQRVLALWLEQSGGRKDVTQAHYDALEELIFGQSGRSLDLPGGRCVLRDQISLRMSRIDHPSSLRREDFREDFSTRVFPAGKNVQFPKKIYTKWLDYDTISEPLCFRSRKEGDYLMLPDGGRQSLQDFLVNEKIPLGERDSIPLAASGSHVLWVVGHRISAAAKITDKTKTIIEIIYGGEYGEASSGRTDRQ